MMTCNEALGHIRTLAKVGSTTDDPNMMRRHLRDILMIIENFDRSKVVQLRPDRPRWPTQPG